MMPIKHILISFVLLSVIPASAWRSRKMDLSAALKFELNQLLQATSNLHQACHKRDEKKIEQQLKDVIFQINRAHNKSGLAEEQRPHLVKILNAAKTNLMLSQSQTGERRNKSLKEAFAQIVQVTKIYKLDRYRVFFCPKDKSVWVQKSWKAKNPIHPVKYKNCGKLVN